MNGTRHCLSSSRRKNILFAGLFISLCWSSFAQEGHEPDSVDQIEDGARVQQLLKDLATGDTSIANKALYDLEQFQGGAAKAPLIAVLKDPSSPIHSAVVSILTSSGPTVLPDIVEILVNGPDPARIAAAQVIESMVANSKEIGFAAPSALRKLMLSSNPAVRAAALRVLTRIRRGESALTYALKYAKDDSPEVQAAAMHALGEAVRGEVDISQAVSILRDGLNSAAPITRVAAAQVIGNLAENASITQPLLPELLACLDSHDAPVQDAAIYALGRIAKPAGVLAPKLFAAFHTSAPPQSRAHVLNALASLKDPPDTVFPTLLDGLKDSDPDVRKEAARVLGNFDHNVDARVAALVRAVKEDPAITVRVEALYSLTRNGEKRSDVLELVRATLDSPELDLRKGAVDALGALGPSAVAEAPRLLQLVELHGVAGVGAVGSALRKMGPEVIPVLLDALQSGNADVRKVAAGAFEIPDDRLAYVISQLQALLYSPRPEVQLAAVDALRNRNRPGVEALAMAYLQPEIDSNAALQKTILEALTASIPACGCKYDSPGSVETMSVAVNLLDSPHPEARRVALTMLASIQHVPSDLAARIMPAVLRVLDDEDRVARTAATRIVAHAGAPAHNALPKLLSLLKDADAPRRVDLVDAIGAAGGAAPEAIEALVALTRAPERDLRLHVVAALARLSGAPDRLADGVAILLEDPSVKVRLATFNEFTGRMPHSEKVDRAIKKCLNHFDPAVRRAAIVYLPLDEMPATREILSKALSDPDSAVSQRAAFALEKCGDPGRAALRNALLGPDEHAAFAALAPFRGVEFRRQSDEFAIAALNSPHAKVRQYAALTKTEWVARFHSTDEDSKHAVAILGEAIENGDAEMRSWAAKCLAEVPWLASPVLGVLANAIEKETDPEVRDALTKARDIINPLGTEWEVVEEQIPVDRPQYPGRHLQFSLLLGRPKQRFLLGRLCTGDENAHAKENESGAAGFDRTSLKVSWLQPSRLLYATWDTLNQGNGHYIHGSFLVLLKTGDTWSEIYRHTEYTNTRGGWESSDHSEFNFQFDEPTSTLNVTRTTESFNAITEPMPLAVPQEEAIGGKKYYFLSYSVVSAWRYKLAGKRLEYVDGDESVDLKDESFPVSEVAKALMQDHSGDGSDATKAEQALRDLNPRLKGVEACSGVVKTGSIKDAPILDPKIYYGYDN